MLLCKLNNVNKVTEKEVYDRNWRAKKVVTNIHEEGLALTKRVAVHSADDATTRQFEAVMEARRRFE